MKAAEAPSWWDFKVIETPHFRIVFNAEQQELGRYYAARAEETIQKVGLFFSQWPEKVTVVITDRTDLPNGYATVVPYPLIVLYPVLPLSNDSLSGYRDWGFELLGHELTHVMSFVPTRNFLKALRYVLGSVVAPNLLMPLWWKEGIAVAVESMDGGGRLNSDYQESVLRAIALEGAWKDLEIADINEVDELWPEGLKPYLFGSVIWSEMVAKGGAKVIDKVPQAQGGRMPFFINSPVVNQVGEDYAGLYQAKLVSLTEKIRQDTEKLKMVTPSEYTFLSQKFKATTGPAISIDGVYLAFSARDQVGNRNLQIWKKDPKRGFVQQGQIENEKIDSENQIKDAPPSGSIYRMQWYHNSRNLLYDKVDGINEYENYSDLYIYNPETKKGKQLTHGLRAREATVAPDDQQIAFVGLGNAKTYLATLNPETLKVEKLIEGEFFERFSGPVYWDQDQLIYSRRNAQGKDSVEIMDLKTKTFRVILADFADASGFVRSSGGLLFSSAASGLRNIYASADLETAMPLTHLLTGSYTFARDTQTQDLYTTLMTARGPQIVKISKEEQERLPQTLPVATRVSSYELKLESEPVEPKKSDEEAELAFVEKADYVAEDYSPWSYLWPRYWVPFVGGTSASEGVAVQVLIAGNDPLQRHQYTLSYLHDTGINSNDYSFSYANSSYRVPWKISAYQSTQALAATADPERLVQTYSSVGFLPSLYSLSSNLGMEIGYRYGNQSVVGVSTTSINVDEGIQRGPYTLFTYVDYSRTAAQISPESGWGTYLGAVTFERGENLLGYDLYYGGWNYYFSKWLPARHAISWKVNGFYIPNDDVNAYNGVATDSLQLNADGMTARHVLRGYANNQFHGTQMLSTNIEYRFPLFKIKKGYGTKPFYMDRLHAAVFYDAVQLKGIGYSEENLRSQRLQLTTTVASAGAEIKLDTTVGYVFPLTFILGYYVPLNTEFRKDPSVGFALGLGKIF